MAQLISGFRPVLLLALCHALALSWAYGGKEIKRWCGLIDTALVGWNTSSVPAKTHKLCHLACLESPGCESANYWLQSKMCELNSVSHFSVSARYLVQNSGSVYTYDRVRHHFLEKSLRLAWMVRLGVNVNLQAVRRLY